jgi:hypothetical protein
MPHINPKDLVAVAATSTVTLTDNTTLASPAVNMRDYDSVMFIINATDADEDTTIDAAVQTDTASAFSSPTALSGFAIAQDTLANASQAYIITVTGEDVAAGNAGDTFVRVLVTMGNGTSGGNCSIVALGFNANYMPPTNAATVIESV